MCPETGMAIDLSRNQKKEQGGLARPSIAAGASKDRRRAQRGDLQCHRPRAERRQLWRAPAQGESVYRRVPERPEQKVVFPERDALAGILAV